MPSKSRLFATNHDMGSASAMAPALQKLKLMGWEIVTFAPQDAPAFQVFSQANLEPQTPLSYGFEECTSDAMDQILRLIAPDLVLVGVSVSETGSEKLALRSALKANIPTAFIVETWPHRWLDVYGKRDVPLYGQADLAMVTDETSSQYMISCGFSRDVLVVTGNPSEDGFAANIAKRDAYRRETREAFHIPPDAVVIQWSMALDLDDPEQDKPGHSEWMGFSERESVKEFLTAIRDVQADGSRNKVIGVIRQKPTHGSKIIRDLIKEICPEVIFDNGRETGIPLLLAADVVCGAVTMMIQNAAKLGIPGVFYFPDLPSEKDPMIANKLGFTIGMYRRGDLRDLILDAGKIENLSEKLTEHIIPIDLSTDATDQVVQAIRDFVDA